MPKATVVELKPRKTPVQERSTASVQAIREAAIQVLLAVGKEQLTTTRVAARAGVSVGTLYQYFPNKSSLLQDVLKAHLDRVYGAVEQVCEQAKGRPLAEMADALVTEFLRVKMEHAATSRALYFVNDDVGGMEIARSNMTRGVKAVAAMFASSSDPLRIDAEVMASTVMAALAGVSRRMLESGRVSPKMMQAMRTELDVLARAYVGACVG
ncbi:MAG: TetR/AcrR family transcriptional regulator [Edaphobacter sp.]|uniref:TetR/AcrR family transcriptional regulator n=1 Tax=Edaphobacter sp. TaxID=1934404 RepID=UPI0023897A9B|nr:TetR/AcrR family transcriptional regulator [Edaphobacter sp.]MDE1176687.1 TetR/AcrR family transcriptional regulator [Edaphobacter sp.]